MKSIKLKYLLSVLAVVSAVVSFSAFASVPAQNIGKNCPPDARSDGNPGELVRVEIKAPIKQNNDEESNVEIYCVYKVYPDRSFSKKFPLQRTTQGGESVIEPTPAMRQWQPFSNEKENGWKCLIANNEKCGFTIFKQGS